MFTVVITDKKHIDKIEEYDMFLSPLLKRHKFAFCQWNSDKTTIEEALPDLYTVVGNKEIWRAVILYDPKNINQKNPFDFINHEIINREDFQDQESYEEAVRNDRAEAYNKAINNPLVQLAYWFGNKIKFDEEDKTLGEVNPEYGQYIAEMEMKYNAYSKLSNDLLKVTEPSKIICMSMRCYENEDYDIKQSWKDNKEIEYSRFYEYNLYPDKFRYVVYDILPEEHLNYRFDYLKYIYTVLVVAANDAPSNALNPQRVYKIECKDNEQNLSRLLSIYDQKLRTTCEELEYQIKELERKDVDPVNPNEFESKFLTEESIIMQYEQDFDEKKLYANYKDLGYAKDSPKSENLYWEAEERKVKKALKKFLKQPKRAVNKAAYDVKRAKKVNIDEALGLSEYQVEDIQEHIDEQEQKMVSLKTSNVYDVKKYNEQLEEASKGVQNKIDVRMTKSTTVLLLVVSVIAYFIGFIPFLIDGIINKESLSVVTIMIVSSIALLLVVAIVAIICFRHSLIKRIKHFNAVMKRITITVNSSVEKFGSYLSSAKTMMRDFSVVKAYQKEENSSIRKIKLFKKHIRDMKHIIGDNKLLFREVVRNDAKFDRDVEPYDFDFERIASHNYPLPANSIASKKINYMQEGNQVEIPVDFIDEIIVKREEIYD